MKKIIFGLIALSTIYSCSNSLDLPVSETNSDNKVKQISVNSKFSQNELEDFKNDSSLIQVINNIDNYKKSLTTEDIELRKKILDEIVDDSKILINRYGEDQLFAYLKELGKASSKYYGSQDGSSCTRNLDGTTYWENCSFWESVSVTISSAIMCHGSSSTSPEQINNYYNCVQDRICKTC